MTDSKNRREDIIPNEAGIPCDSQDTDKIIDEHARWRRAIERRSSPIVDKSRYWKQMARCPSL